LAKVIENYISYINFNELIMIQTKLFTINRLLLMFVFIIISLYASTVVYAGGEPSGSDGGMAFDMTTGKAAPASSLKGVGLASSYGPYAGYSVPSNNNGWSGGSGGGGGTQVLTDPAQCPYGGYLVGGKENKIVKCYPAPPPPPPTPPTFNGSGAGGSGKSISIINGNLATLTWSCADSSSSSGSNFSTRGAMSGSAEVTPTTTTLYTLLCSNGGQGTVTVTVLYPELTITATPSLLRIGDTSVIEWTTTATNSCEVSEDNPDFTDAWSGLSGTQTSSPITGETVYALSCQTDGGPVSETVRVRLIPIFQEF